MQKWGPSPALQELRSPFPGMPLPRGSLVGSHSLTWSQEHPPPFAFQSLLKTSLNLLSALGREQRAGLTFQVSGTFQSSSPIAQGQKYTLTIA